jgi:O-antigen ligase
MSRKHSEPKSQDSEIYRYLRLYLLLVIYEGVFRKWIRLTDQDIFYFARDIFIMLSILRISTSNRFKNTSDRNIRILLIVIFTFFITYAYLAIVVQNTPVPVVAFGFRNYSSVLLLAYLCSYLQDKSRIFETIYRSFLVSLIFQLPLVLLQVISAKDSFINRTGWEIGATFFTSGEVVRPPGTFTNALGLGYYLLITFGLILSAFLNGFETKRSANVNLVALFMLVVISAISGSRTVLLGLFLATFLYVILRIKKMINRNATSNQLKKSSRFIAAIMSISITYVLYKLTNVINAFLFRIRYQTEGGSGTKDRIVGAVFDYNYSEMSLLGNGIGTHHQSALALGWIEPWVENEVSRWISELGIFGLVLILVRQFWIVFLAASIFARNVKYVNIGPIIFIALGLIP